MYNVDVGEILIDPEILDKIAAKHAMSLSEAGQVVSSDQARWRRGRDETHVVSARPMAADIASSCWRRMQTSRACGGS